MKPSLGTKSASEFCARPESAEARLRPSNRQWRAGLLVLGFILGSCAFWFWLQRYDPKIFRENGPMENFQAASLVVGILFLARAVRNSALHPGRRVLLVGLIIFYSTLALLEFDVREFHISWLTWLLNGRPRNVSLGCVWLGAFGLFLRRARTTWMEFLAWLYTSSAALLLLAGFFWAVGWFIDHLKFFSTFDQNLMAEELMEAIAAPLMLASAILTWRMTTKPRTRQVMVNTGLPSASAPPKGTNLK